MVFKERIKEQAKIVIKRFASREDFEKGKVYSRKEARLLFGVPQITVIQGGLLGAIRSLWDGTFFSTVFVQLKGINIFSLQGLKKFFKVFKRMFHGNVLLNEGINELWTLVCSSSGTKFDNANAYIGVGDSSDAEDASQTGLLGSNKAYKGMDAGFPEYGTNQKATWQATFGENEANFAWNEFTVANGSDDTAVNLNRKVSAQGTKSSGQVWQVQVEISLS